MTERSSRATDRFVSNRSGPADRAATDTAVFLNCSPAICPPARALVAAGLEQALQFLETCSFLRPRSNGLKAPGAWPNLIVSFLVMLHRRRTPCRRVSSSPTSRSARDRAAARQFVRSRLISISPLSDSVAAKAARMMLAAPSRCWRFRLPRAPALKPA
jgi:hypothetical protein